MQLLSGRSQYTSDKPEKNGGGRLVGIHVNKGLQFRLALPRAYYCDNSA